MKRETYASTATGEALYTMVMCSKIQQVLLLLLQGKYISRKSWLGRNTAHAKSQVQIVYLRCITGAVV